MAEKATGTGGGRATGLVTSVLVWLVLLSIPAATVGGGGWLLYQRAVGTKVEATVLACETSGNWARYSPTIREDCAARWTIAGREVTGNFVGGNGESDVGKTLTATVRGDTAYSRSLVLPILLILLGLPVLVPLLLGLRRRRPAATVAAPVPAAPTAHPLAARTPHGTPLYRCANDDRGLEAAPDREGVLVCPACGHRTDLPGVGSLVDAFDLAPGQWGLRGDPHVWQALRDHVGGTPTPSDPDEIRAVLVEGLREVADLDVDTAQEPIHREEFAHGGMSSGMVDPSFWREQAIPLLVDRAQARRPL